MAAMQQGGESARKPGGSATEPGGASEAKLGQRLSHTREGCACVHFVHIFGPMLKLAPLSRDELDKALGDPSALSAATPGVGGASTATLPDLHWKLLRPGTDAPRPDGESWYTELRKQAADGVIRLGLAMRQDAERRRKVIQLIRNGIHIHFGMVLSQFKSGVLAHQPDQITAIAVGLVVNAVNSNGHGECFKEGG